MKKLIYFLVCCCCLVCLSACQSLLDTLKFTRQSKATPTSVVPDSKNTSGYAFVDSVLQIHKANLLQIQKQMSNCFDRLKGMDRIRTEFFANGLVVRATISTSVLFEPNSSSLSDDGEKLLTTMIDSLKGRSELRLRILGFTDNQVSPYIGVPLSSKRAQSVQAFFCKEGFSEKGLHSVGMGNQNPVSDNATEEGRSKNRRIEIYLLPPNEKELSK